MNAPERLWRALASRHWDAVSSQFHPGAIVEWPHSGEQLSVDEYVAAQRERPPDRRVEVRRSTGDGELFAIEASVGTARCAGLYDIHEGRISAATEYWIGDVG
jgi:hypothetical protein